MTKFIQGQGPKGAGRDGEGCYLSVHWIVLMGTLILAWISVAPLVWIGCMLVNHGDVSDAAALAVIGLLAFAWNVLHLRHLLHEMFEDGIHPLAGPGRKVRVLIVFATQMVVAAACTHLAGPFNPIGLQQWFWMPIAAFAGLIMRRSRCLVVAILLTLAVSTTQEYLVKGPVAATFWAFGQITTSVFIMSCAYAVTHASRQRQKVAQLAAELRSANARLELQADQAAVLAVAEERNRLAREIHDAVGHGLTVVGAQLEVALALWQQDAPGAREAVRKAQRAAREGLTEIRRSVAGMRAAGADQRTLAEALTALMTSAEKPGMKLSLQQSGISRQLPALVEMSLYRCAQEGITNSCRHSGASEISVHLDFSGENYVALTVTDNGRGFGKIPENSHGLIGLRERAFLLRGSLTAGTGPNGGGHCRMVLPL